MLHRAFVLGSILIGVVIFYCAKGREGIKTFTVPLTAFLPSERARESGDFMVFVLLGVVVCLILADPQTTRQGFAAGLGWTGFLTKEAKGKGQGQ